MVAVTGPRQSGKTTLARSEFADLPYFNLEAPDTRFRIEADPRGFLESVPQGAVLDEFQRIPELVSYIQVVVDENPRTGRFILTGSQQFEVMSKVSQSLAGRVGLLKLLPLAMQELLAARVTPASTCGTACGNGLERANRWMFTGFYPRIYDHRLPPSQVLSDYFSTYVQRDVRSLTNVTDASQFEKFVRLCAGRVGQVLNLQNLAQDLGVAHATAGRWLTILQASFIVHLVQPYYWPTTKRLIKSPKMYFYDVGLASWLNGIESPAQLVTHPLRGHLFENLILMETLKFRLNRGLRDNLYFYRDNGAAGVDLILELANGIFPIEIKAGITLADDSFKGLRHLAKVVVPPPGKPPDGGGLVYGGTNAWVHAGTQVVGFEQLDALLRACGAGARPGRLYRRCDHIRRGFGVASWTSCLLFRQGTSPRSAGAAEILRGSQAVCKARSDRAWASVAR